MQECHEVLEWAEGVGPNTASQGLRDQSQSVEGLVFELSVDEEVKSCYLKGKDKNLKEREGHSRERKQPGQRHEGPCMLWGAHQALGFCPWFERRSQRERKQQSS